MVVGVHFVWTARIRTASHIAYQYRPLFKEGVVTFLENEDGLPCEATYDNLIGLVYKNEHWTKEIFDVKVSSVPKFSIEAMFLQLIAANLLSVDVIKGKLMWIVSRQNIKGRYPPHNWKLDTSWISVWLQSKTKVQSRKTKKK